MLRRPASRRPGGLSSKERHMRSYVHTRVLLFLISALGASILASAGGSTTASAGAAVSGAGVLRIDFDTDVDYVDPGLAYFSVSWQIEQATCAKLLNFPDASREAGRRLVPEVARKLPSVSRDRRTYTFHLRDDFFFAPPWNERVTPAHFKYALERELNPVMASPARTFFGDIVGADDVIAGRTTSLAGVVANGDTLRITLEEPAGNLPARLAMPFACPLPLDTPLDPRGISAPVPSAGPYYIDTWERGTRLHVSRNPNYRGDRPARFDELEYAFSLPLETIRQRIESGESDFGNVPLSAHAELAQLYGPDSGAAAAGRQRWFADPAAGFRYLAFNHDRPLFGSGGPLGNVNLKQAVNFAIDRLAMIAARGAYAGQPTDQYVPSVVPGFQDAALYPNRPDVARARELAGWHPGDPMRRTVLYTCNTVPCLTTADIVKQDLAEIGLDVEIHSFPRAVQFTKAGTRGEPYDITLEGWLDDYLDPYDTLFLLDGTTIRPAENTDLAYFDDPEFNAKLHAANRLAGDGRTDALGALDVETAAGAAPLAAYMNDNVRSFFSDRIGCHVYQPALGSISLAALCLRPEVRIGDASVDEPGETASFAVTLSSKETVPVSVDFTTVDGSAHAGTDYEPSAGTITFAPGEQTKTLSVRLLSHGTGQSDEGKTFLVRLTGTSRGTLVDAEATASIEHDHASRTVTVMTRNLYLGTELQPIFAAPTPPALFAAVEKGYAQVEASNFPERAEELAAEISDAGPDLVALQEATLYRTDTPPDGPATPAEAVTLDFLRLLLDALEGQGTSYDVVGTLTGTDAELPSGFPPTRDIRLTDRIAVLSRSGRPNRLNLSDVRTGTFAAKLVVPTAAGPLTLPRGWISVDAEVNGGGQQFRFVATHLEAFDPRVQVAQGNELLAGPTATPLPVVLAGDLNSRADGRGTPTYANLLVGGFEDAWSAAGKGPGLTCCHPPSLLGSSVFDKRIDLVLTRRARAVKAEVVGEEEDDRTASGRWPSDHAGVVTRLQVR
jgi:ABC-type transport system substrate-binding protein/endonuclease/exonuclease/phosphatase family metal-dependent hydrolase